MSNTMDEMAGTVTDIGVIDVKGCLLRVVKRGKSATLWIVGAVDGTDDDIATIKDPHSAEPTMTLFQRHQRMFGDPWTRWHIIQQVKALSGNNTRIDRTRTCDG